MQLYWFLWFILSFCVACGSKEEAKQDQKHSSEVTEEVTELSKQEILRVLDSLKTLSLIETITAKGDPILSKAEEEQVNNLSKLLPSVILDEVNFDVKDRAAWQNFVRKWLNSVKLEQTSGLGGHAGTYLAEINLKNNSYRLFLKLESDPTESRNYTIIQDLAPNLTTLIPVVYGSMNLSGKRYLVMQNLMFDSKGTKWKPIADIKLAGKLPHKPTFNPVMDQEEMLTTRGRKKGAFLYTTVLLRARTAPNYYVATADTPAKKELRGLHFVKSEETLMSILQGLSHKAKESLLKKISHIAREVEKSPLAFIGSSILLLKAPNDQINVLLIDPAHLQVDPKLKNQNLPSINQNERTKIYYGTDQDFANRKKSNKIAFDAIIATIKKAL